MKKMKNQFQRMTVAISLVLAGSVNAAVMSFTNPPPGDPGHVDWATIRFLDITKASTDQAGVNGFGTFEFSISESFDVFTSTFERGGGIGPGFGGRVFREVQPGGNVEIGHLQPGDIVGPGGAIPQGGGGVYSDVWVGGIFQGGNKAAPLGESFIGVSFATAVTPTMFTDFHFGWIGFNLFETPGGPHGLEVTRWGYETTIDTAITIPSPGAAPLLLTATALLTSRRRRRDRD